MKQNVTDMLCKGKIVEISTHDQCYGVGIILQQLQFGGVDYFDVLIPAISSISMAQRGAEPVLTLINQNQTANLNLSSELAEEVLSLGIQSKSESGDLDALLF